MREDLLGYLLGALDADEQRRIETELATNADLRSELRKLRECLEPLDSLSEEFEPSAGLANRVVRAIDHYESEHRPTPRSVLESRAAAIRADESRLGSSRRYSVSDGVVLALVGLAAFTLFLPALANSRYAARITTCQDNLRNMGTHLIQFSDQQPNQEFPYVPLSGNYSFAGFFAPRLLENGVITERCRLLICPGSDLAEQPDRWYVPSFQELDVALGRRLVRLQNQAGGSYANSIGYFDGRQYYAVRNRSRAQFALLADAPTIPGRLSANHGPRGMNICYEDGHVVFVTNPHGRADDPLRNQFGYAEVGIGPHDSVVLTSGMRPAPPTNSMPTSKSMPVIPPLE